jgi:hypothetical protein
MSEYADMKTIYSLVTISSIALEIANEAGKGGIMRL